MGVGSAVIASTAPQGWLITYVYCSSTAIGLKKEQESEK